MMSTVLAGNIGDIHDVYCFKMQNKRHQDDSV